jgi:protein involved in polysaccharide export with SLBB domain
MSELAPMRIFRIALVSALLFFVAIANASAQSAQSSGDQLQESDSLIQSDRQQKNRDDQSSARQSQSDSRSLSAWQPADDSTLGTDKGNEAQTNSMTAPLSVQQDASAEELSDDSVDSPEAQQPSRAKATLKGRISRKASANAQKKASARVLDDHSKRDVDEPVMRERKNPYANLPALRDLYQQLQVSDQEPTRFGIESFRTRTQSTTSDLQRDDSQNKDSQVRNSQLTGGFPDQGTLEVGVDSSYVLGPGDALKLDLWGGISQRLNKTVDHEGRIALPEVGNVVVAGKSLADAQKLVEASLARQFRNIHAELSLARLRNVRIYVVGEVDKPGAYDLSSVSTALNALFAAGGPTARGSMRRLRHYRGAKLLEEIDLYDFLLLGVRQDTLRFESGDTLQVPIVGPQVTVAGTVKRPAIYELREEKQLAQVIQLAGGLRNTANLRQISLERVEAHQRHSMLNIAVAPDSSEAAVISSLERLQVSDGDRVTVFPIVPYNQGAVYLDGHVFQPGRYAFHDGMTVAELLRSRDQLLPEPSDHVEVIHLAAPDFRPVAEELSLEQIFNGSKVELHAFDTVRLFGRYETDAPKVAIWGEVLRQGEYPLSANMSASDLVRLAGGFKRGALRTSADLTSYALKAADSATLGGLPPSAFALARPNAAATNITTSSPTIVPTKIVNPQPSLTVTNAYDSFVPLFSGSAGDLTSSNIYQAANGAIGVNTTAPASGFHVTTNLPGIATFQRIGGARFTFQNYLDNDASGAGSIFYVTDSTARQYQPLKFDALTLQIRPNGDPANSFYVDSSGKVGFGTTSPTDRLTVNGNIALLSAGVLKFADGTTQATAARSGISATSPDSSIAIGGTTTAPTIIVANAGITDAKVHDVSAAKITGQLADMQLSTISAAKITGQIADAQIASVSASKVTGTLALAQIAAGNLLPQAEESLRMLRTRCTGTSGTLSCSGLSFTAAKTSTGAYQFTIENAFASSDVPVVTVSAIGSSTAPSNWCSVTNATYQSFSIACFNLTGPADVDFNVIVLGAR